MESREIFRANNRYVEQSDINVRPQEGDLFLVVDFAIWQSSGTRASLAARPPYSLPPSSSVSPDIEREKLPLASPSLFVHPPPHPSTSFLTLQFALPQQKRSQADNLECSSEGSTHGTGQFFLSFWCLLTLPTYEGLLMSLSC